MADAGRLKGDPEEKDTKLSNSDMDNTKEMESELAQSITEYAEMPKAASGDSSTSYIFCIHSTEKSLRDLRSSVLAV